MKLRGRASSPGKAQGRIRIMEGLFRNAAEPSATQAVTYDEAVGQVKAELEKARMAALEKAGDDAAEIFAAQMMIADDPLLKEAAMDYSGGVTDGNAVLSAAEGIAASFDAIEDEYIKARGADIRQVGAMIANAMAGRSFMAKLGFTGDLPAPVVDAEGDGNPIILAAYDITPVQAVEIDTAKVAGIALEAGAVNSHASILARAMGIPCLIGVSGLMGAVEDGAPCFMDADSGDLFLDEESVMPALPEDQHGDFSQHFSKLLTEDGFEVGLSLNIGSLSEMDRAEASNLGGFDVGLMRTEFLFMGRPDCPSFEEQREVYRSICQKAWPSIVRFRTLDVGGDKKPPFVEIESEENPYLGLRSIRYSLRDKRIFRGQLKALASVALEYSLEIMFPMLTVIEELEEAKEVLKESFEQAGEPAITNIRVGIMLETPASCIMTDAFAKHCDFLSIGTNDLVQYVMAADRGNNEVEGLYQQLNPAVLRLVSSCVAACRKAGKELSVCGELAGSPEGAIILSGLGVSKLSMSPANVKRVAEALSKVTLEEMRNAASSALFMETQDEVIRLLENLRRR